MRTSSFVLVAAQAVLAGAAFAGPPGWEFVPTPIVKTEAWSVLEGVHGVASNDVWAVGHFSPQSTPFSGPPQTLAMHWNGSEWNQMSMPTFNANLHELHSILALAPDNVIAIGGYNPTGAGPTQSLTSRWDGSSWNLIENQLFVECGSILWDIAQAGKDIWAVGTGGCPPDPSMGFPGLAARWEGNSWQMFPVPTISTGRAADRWYGVSGLSENDVWAVGTARLATENFQVLILHFDGSSWRDASPATPGSNDALYDVVAIAPDNAWAIGKFRDTGLLRDQPLIMHFDGLGWTQYPVPVVPNGAGELRSITARAADDIWAVGTTPSSTGVPNPLIMHYDGVSWQAVAAGRSDGSSEWFRAIAAIPGGDVWTVGQYFDGALSRTTSQRLSETTRCPADFNVDDAVNSQDFFDFLVAFFAGDADFNDDSLTNSQDFFDFLTMFFDGCP